MRIPTTNKFLLAVDAAGRAIAFAGAVVAMLAAVAGPLGPAAFADDAPAMPVREQGALEPRSLEQVQRSLDDLARQQTGVMDRVAAEMSTFVKEFSSVGKDVADRTNSWIQDPTPERQAALVRAVCEGAARAREASQKLAGARSVVSDQVGAIRMGIGGQIAEATTERAAAATEAASHEADVKQLQQAAVDLYKALAERGLLAKADTPLPPEVEEEIYRLKVEVEDKEILAAISKDVAAHAEDFVKALRAADSNYVEIARIVDRIAYRAESAEPVFTAIGRWGVSTIQWRLVADAYGRSAPLRDQMVGVLQRFRAIGESMTALKAGMVPRPQKPQAPPKPSAPAQQPELRAWLERMAGTTRDANAPVAKESSK